MLKIYFISIPNCKLMHFFCCSARISVWRVCFWFHCCCFGVFCCYCCCWQKVFGIKHSEQQRQQIDNSQNLLQGQSELETRISFWQLTHTKDLGNELAKTLALDNLGKFLAFSKRTKNGTQWVCKMTTRRRRSSKRKRGRAEETETERKTR